MFTTAIDFLYPTVEVETVIFLSFVLFLPFQLISQYRLLKIIVEEIESRVVH